MSDRTRGKNRKSDLQLAGETIAHAVKGRLLLLKALFPLLLGAIFLTGAWQFYQDERRLQELHASLTKDGEGEIIDAWWRLDFDAAGLGDATNWQAATRPELCVQLRHQPTAAAASDAVFCRRWGRISYGADLLRWSEFGNGTAVPWRNDLGLPEVRLHYGADAYEWLRSHEAWDRYGFTADERPMALEAFLLQLDQPAELLIHAWSQPASIELRFDPEDPSRALPQVLLASNRPFAGDRVAFLVIPAFVGVVVWFMGCFILFLTSPGWLRTLVAVGSLALLPWWGNWIWKGMDLIWSEASLAVTLMRTELLGAPPAIRIHPPTYRGEPGDVRHPWNLETSLYAPAFELLDLSYPGMALDPEEALRGLVARVEQGLLEADAAAATETFRFLAEKENGRRVEAGLLFMEAARKIALDETRGQSLRYAALRFLRERSLSGHFVSAYRTAPELRLSYYLALREVPDAALGHGLRLVLENTRKEWQEQGRPFPDINEP